MKILTEKNILDFLFCGGLFAGFYIIYLILWAIGG
jgi:hypothetical protein